ncbi:phospholipase A2 isoform X1 [Columba livia]
MPRKQLYCLHQREESIQPALLALISYTMEILDEFDNEHPLSTSFCELISIEDFEEQALSYTQQCLRELYSAMEQDPRICERILRKQKQKEKEEAGLISYLKAKIFKALQGELNYCNYMDIAEMKKKVLQLRRDMQKVNSYACAAKTGKGRHPRQSWGKKHTLEYKTSHLHASVSEPRQFTMPRVFGPVPEAVNEADRAMTSSPLLKYWCTSLTAVRHVRPLGSAPAPSQNAGSTGTKPAASVFNTPVSHKLQGGTEDDTDSEEPSPSSSAEDA